MSASPAHPALFDEDRTYHVREVAKALGLSRSYLYRLMEQGKLDHLRLGGTYRIPGWSANSLVSRSLVSRTAG